MKKITKICGLCAVAMLIPGVILLSVGAVLGGSFETAMSQNGFYNGNLFYNQSAYEALTEVTVVEVEESATENSYLPSGVENARQLDILVEAENIQLNKGEAFSVVNHGLENDQIISYMEGTTWHIEVEHKYNTSGSLYITVPQTMVFEKISLHSDVGQITGTGADAVYFEADTDTGKIELTDVNAQMMQLEADVGTIEIWGTVEQAASLNADVGTVVLRVPKPDEYGYDITCEMGKVTLFDETFNGMESHRQFNKDQPLSLTPVPLFTLNCEMGKVQVLESAREIQEGHCQMYSDNTAQSVERGTPHHRWNTRNREYYYD